MENGLVKMIDKELRVVNLRGNYSKKEVFTALNIISQASVRLFWIKVLKRDFLVAEGEGRKFDFWNAVKDERIKECFGEDLLKKIKETVKRCQESINALKFDPNNAIFYEDLIVWASYIAREAQRKINNFCKAKEDCKKTRYKWRYQDDYECCKKYLISRFVEKKRFSLTTMVDELSQQLPQIPKSSIQMKIGNIEYLVKHYNVVKYGGGTLSHFSKQNKEALFDAINDLGILPSELDSRDI